jgi:hypothetical protein
MGSAKKKFPAGPGEATENHYLSRLPPAAGVPPRPHQREYGTLFPIQGGWSKQIWFGLYLKIVAVVGLPIQIPNNICLEHANFICT